MLFQVSSNSSYQKQEHPINIFLESTASSIVFGCPGISRSIPRIEANVQVRSNNGLPFPIRSISIVLLTRQKVSVPTKFGSNDAFKEFKLYEDPLAFKPINGFSEKLLGLDLPILIPIPRDVTSSGCSTTFGSITTHYLTVKVITGESSATEVSFVEMFPVVIKLYDTLPLYRQFNEPVVEIRNSPDNQIIAEITIPNSSIGPGDQLNINCKLMTNSSNNKIKKHLQLKQQTFQVKEFLECYDGGLPPLRENKIHSITTHPNQELNTQGIISKFSFEFPKYHEFLDLFKQSEPLIISQEVVNDYDTTVIDLTNISNQKLMDKLIEGLPITHIQSFTSQGRFFSIKFEIIVKLKFSKAKDFDIKFPITICPYDRESSEYLLQWIMHECEVAKARFGKQFIDQFFASKHYNDICALMSSYKAPPTVYRYCREDWIKLGHDGDSFGKSKNIVSFID
ncbi:uncharacterized protein KGF55_004299 [Candida pseudojiufengensis]|uniref:uncharacterized protein n=1 Tax=Candida pseudojiufengensis TaxID=497109 RepID=UPI0022250261|nr:uncharacterized protein KGF55_004299 [Candida pseudojiufengensis]KAI5961032.1 hypothetical protein KGF55_004299 [Candida pseudojiufengensis]